MKDLVCYVKDFSPYHKSDKKLQNNINFEIR